MVKPRRVASPQSKYFREIGQNSGVVLFIIEKKNNTKMSNKK